MESGPGIPLFPPSPGQRTAPGVCFAPRLLRKSRQSLRYARFPGSAKGLFFPRTQPVPGRRRRQRQAHPSCRNLPFLCSPKENTPAAAAPAQRPPPPLVCPEVPLPGPWGIMPVFHSRRFRYQSRPLGQIPGSFGPSSLGQKSQGRPPSRSCSITPGLGGRLSLPAGLGRGRRVQRAKKPGQGFGSNIAGRRTAGGSAERSSMVDSRPTGQGPPSRMTSIRPPRSSNTWPAIVGLGRPLRLALGAATGTPAASISAWATASLGKRMATVSRPAVTCRGT